MIGAPRIIHTEPLGAGDKAAYQVVGTMARLVREDRSASVGSLAAALRRALPESSPLTLMRGVYDLLQEAYRFKADPLTAETVKTPDRQAREIHATGKAVGDCDDRATLAGALLKRLGLPAYFVLVSERQGVDFHHVYYASSEPERTPARGVDMRVVIPFDPQENVTPGRWAPWDRRQVFRVV